MAQGYPFLPLVLLITALLRVSTLLPVAALLLPVALAVAALLLAVALLLLTVAHLAAPHRRVLELKDCALRIVLVQAHLVAVLDVVLLTIV